jgi:hypothetical protein
MEDDKKIPLTTPDPQFEEKEDLTLDKNNQPQFTFFENKGKKPEKRPSLIFKKIKVISIPVSVIVFIFYAYITVTNYPNVTVNFKNYSGPVGISTFWEATVDIQKGRPAGIRNLLLKFEFPEHINKYEIISDGGCKNAVIKTDPLTDPTYRKWDRVTEKSGSLFADMCPDGAKLILRFKTAHSAFDDRPCPDNGLYTGAFDWPLPIIGKVIPWSFLEYGSKMKGEIPPSPQEIPYIATHGYPASISKTPYYDLQERKGEIISILDPNDYNNRLKNGISITFFSRPSTKLRMFTEKGGFVVAQIHWLHCNRPIEIREKFELLKSEEIQYIKSNGLKAGIKLNWHDCDAQLDFRCISLNDNL